MDSALTCMPRRLGNRPPRSVSFPRAPGVSSPWLTLSSIAVLLALGATPAASQTGDTLSVSLVGAVQIAVERHPSVVAADLRVTEEETLETQARSQLLPSLSGTALRSQRTFNTATFGFDFPQTEGQTAFFNPDGEVLGPIPAVDFRGQVSQRLFDWSAVRAYQTVGATVDMAAAARESVAATVAGDAARAYVDVLRAEGRLDALRQDLSQAESLLTISEDLLDAGTGILVDVTRARARVASVQADIIAEENAVARTRLELAHAMGVALGTPIALTDQLVEPGGEPEPDPQVSVARALDQRADLAVMERRAEVARLGVSAVRAQAFPTLSLVADAGWAGSKLGNLLGTYSWGLSVSVPVFDGGLRRGRQEQAEAVLRETQVLAGDLETRVELEVRRALIDLRTARQQVDAAQAALELATEELDLARESFEAGVVGNADVVDAGLRLSTSRARQVDALAGYLLATVELERAMGTNYR